MRRSTIIVLAILIVVLAAGITVLSLWPQAEPEEEDPTPAVSDPAKDLIRVPIDEVAGVVFSPAQSAQYTLRLDPESGEIELDAEDAVFPGVQSILSSVFGSATTLANLNQVTEEADDAQLAIFGLDDPVMTWRVDRIDGTSETLMVGAMQAAGKGRYARSENSREVFLLGTRQSTLLTYELEALYDISFFPVELFPDADAVMYMIEHILLETEQNVIELSKRSEEEMAELSLGASQFQMLQPLEVEGNDFQIQNVLLASAALIKPESVEAVHPEDLSIYGLDAPDKLALKSADWSGTLLIGKRDAERGGRYVMIDGYDAVLFDPNGDYSFLHVVISKLRSSLIWIHNIVDVASVTFELDGVTRILKFDHYTDGDKQNLNAWLDDKEISETNARRLYVSALTIMQTGDTDISIPSSSPPYKITMNFITGGSEAVELYQINDSQFLIVHKGVSTGFYITRMSLQKNLLNKFEMIDRGEDLPAS